MSDASGSRFWFFLHWCLPAAAILLCHPSTSSTYRQSTRWIFESTEYDDGVDGSTTSFSSGLQMHRLRNLCFKSSTKYATAACMSKVKVEKAGLHQVQL